MEGELEQVISLLVKNRWPFRLHATYGESIDRDLAVIEKVNAATPLNGLRFIVDHAETITDGQLARIRRLGGGVAVQDRMHFQGEAYWKRYGEQVRHMPPIRKMLGMKLPVGLGTDGTRVSSYSPWPSIYWAATGKTAGGMQIWKGEDVLSRYQALRLMTTGSAWMSGEEKLKGTIKRGQYADFVVLPEDYFTIDAEGRTAATRAADGQGQAGSVQHIHDARSHAAMPCAAWARSITRQFPRCTVWQASHPNSHPVECLQVANISPLHVFNI
jgi:predicted amidohydrolase YtcJ